MSQEYELTIEIPISSISLEGYNFTEIEKVNEFINKGYVIALVEKCKNGNEIGIAFKFFKQVSTIEVIEFSNSCKFSIPVSSIKRVDPTDIPEYDYRFAMITYHDGETLLLQEKYEEILDRLNIFGRNFKMNL